MIETQRKEGCMSRWKIFAVVALLAAGCVPSANMERSILRGAGDTSITAVADAKKEDVQALLDGTKTACTALMKFLDTGSVVNLTTNELETKLISLVDSKYSSIVSQALTGIKVAQLDVNGKIGARNMKRVRAVVKGVLRGSNEYEIGDR